MTFVFYAVLVLHILACFFLITVVLLQQGKGQDLASAFGGGVTQTAFGPRGSANILSRATTVLAALFMVTSLSLSVLRPRSGSFLDHVPAAAPAAPASSAAPSAAPGAPAASPAAAQEPAASTDSTKASAPAEKSAPTSAPTAK